MLEPKLGRRYEVKVMIEGSTKEFCHRKVYLSQFQSLNKRFFSQFGDLGVRGSWERSEAVSVLSQKKPYVVQRWSSEYKRKDLK